MPDMPSSRTAALERVLWSGALAAAAVALVVFLFGVAQRVAYPHELEWMEGALADHAWRVANGLPIYCAPSPEHVPFLYAPLLFWLGGLGIWLGFDPIVALRLVSIAATVGTAMLVGHWVRRETGRVVPGLVASGLFLAGYGWLAWWYDLARNDTLFVLLCVATSYQLRHGGARRWLWAALLAAVALIAKQSALMWLPAVGVGALCVDWRTALRFGAATLVAMGAAVGVLHLGTDGWSTFYLFEMPSHHGWDGGRKLGFWTQDVVPMAPLLLLGVGGFVAACRAREARSALFLAAFGSGAVVTSWLSRLHVGGFDNVLMYGFAGACVLGPIAAAKVATNGNAVLRVGAVALLLAQFVWLGTKAWQRGAVTWLPSAAHRQAHDELAAFVGKQPGPVWVPAHGAITTRAGKGMGAHGMAIFDLLQVLLRSPDGLEALIDHSRLDHLPPRMQVAITSLVDSAAAVLHQRRFAAIVVDEVGGHAFHVVFAAGLAGPDGLPGTGDDPYVRMPGQLLTNPTALAPLLGFEVHSPYALVPRPQ